MPTCGTPTSSMARHILGLTEQDVCYSVAKLFFAFGLGNALTFPLCAGATTILLPDRPTPEAVGALLRRHPVTVLYGVPTFYAGFLASKAVPRRDELKLRLCVSAGEALPAHDRPSVGASATASISSTASARPRCSTPSCRTGPAR